jgi:hypothetical protein
MREVHLWRAWYAWFPVKPADDDGLFWMETVWRRNDPKTGRREYKSFRSDKEKSEELAKREI